MKKVRTTVMVMILTGCTSVDSKENTTEANSNTPEKTKVQTICKTLTSTFRESETKYTVCIDRKFFQPTRFYFYDYGNLIFDGTDYESPLVRFTQKNNDVTTLGVCDELLSIVSDEKLKRLKYKDISQEVIKSCEILPNESDSAHKPFTSDIECKNVTKGLKLVNVGARCLVFKNKTTVYLN